MSTKPGPFHGLRILSFAQIGQGPAAVQLFADFGADVIKVERPGSGAWERNPASGYASRDGESFLFLALNRNQRSIAVDMKDERGKDFIRRIASESDVVIENYRPGVMERLGLGFDDLREVNPRLVYCSTNGYGSTGPYKDMPGQDLLIQGLSGLAATTGRASDPPTPVGSPVVDFHAAAILAFGICAALRQREQTGKGQRVETSLLEAAVHLQWEGLFYQLNGWDITKRSPSGLGSPYHPAPYGIYATADGYVTLSLVPLSLLAKALRIDELGAYDGETALTRREEIKPIIEAATKQRTTGDLLKALRANDVWCGPVLSYEELLEDPQFKASEFVLDWPRAGSGTVRHIRPPLRLGEMPTEHIPRTPAPALGEHTEQVLREHGYEDQLARDMAREWNG